RSLAALKMIDVLRARPSRERQERVDEIKGAITGSEDRGVIRMDLKLPSIRPASKPCHLWLDHALVHETSASYQDKYIEHTPITGEPFRKKAQEKKKKYEGLIEVVKRVA